jgi:ATP-dependent exoDNAse (exonuclease V) alpha subunit
MTLSQEQRKAVELAASSRLLVLTGGPGCGKTFTTHTIISLWHAMGKSLLLAAPTGRHVERVGDRVIQHVNNYQREVFNGDLGTILRIDLEEQEVVAQFAEREVSYDYADLGELAQAWAITVHKSQGSEYPVVILPLFMQHYMLLSRNLLYTGLTRAKQLAILVGPTKAIGLAINRIMDRQCYTALADRLRHPKPSAPRTEEEKR